MPGSSAITTFDQVHERFAAQPGDTPRARVVRGLALALADNWLLLPDCPERAEAIDLLVLATARALDAVAACADARADGHADARAVTVCGRRPPVVP